MEQDFQTSFIPKKPMIDSRTSNSRPIGLIMVISVFIFFAMLIASGGIYFYEDLLLKKIEAKKVQLNAAKERFEPSKITQLQVLDKRLRASTEILGAHLAISPIFTQLEGSTMKSVRYTKFSYLLGSLKEPSVKILMSGVATGYKAVALQADVFSTKKYLIDPVFYNLALDEKGNVLFDLDFSVDPSLVNYKQMLQKSSAEAVAPEGDAETTAPLNQ